MLSDIKHIRESFVQLAHKLEHRGPGVVPYKFVSSISGGRATHPPGAAFGGCSEIEIDAEGTKRRLEGYYLIALQRREATYLRWFVDSSSTSESPRIFSGLRRRVDSHFVQNFHNPFCIAVRKEAADAVWAKICVGRIEKLLGFHDAVLCKVVDDHVDELDLVSIVIPPDQKAFQTPSTLDLSSPVIINESLRVVR